MHKCELSYMCPGHDEKRVIWGNEQSPTVTNWDRGTRRISVSVAYLSRRLSPSIQRNVAIMTGTVEQDHEDNGRPTQQP